MSYIGKVSSGFKVCRGCGVAQAPAAFEITRRSGGKVETLRRGECSGCISKAAAKFHYDRKHTKLR